MQTDPASLLDTVLDRLIAPGYSRIGYAVRRRWWDESDPPRLDGRTVAVTGATSGLGEAAAAGFARLGANVLLLARDAERAGAARARLVAATGSEAFEFVPCDLGDLASVRACVERIRDRHATLDVLVNNAGVLPAERERSTDGIELTFATNVVGPFLLTALLADDLAAAAPSRIVNVASGGMYAQRLHVDDLQMDGEPFDGVTAYARSKRAEVILSELWAARLAPHGVAVHAMHPGWADTPGVRASLPRFHRLTGPLLRTPEQGADTIVWLGAAEPPGESTGGFWHDRRRRPTHLLPTTRETDVDRALLWKRCCELSGWRDPESAAVADSAGARSAEAALAAGTEWH